MTEIKRRRLKLQQETANRILRMPAVRNKTGLGQSTIYDLMKANAFPRPILIGLGLAKGWVEHEIDAWIESRKAERELVEQVGTAAKPHGKTKQ